MSFLTDKWKSAEQLNAIHWVFSLTFYKTNSSTSDVVTRTAILKVERDWPALLPRRWEDAQRVFITKRQHSYERNDVMTAILKLWRHSKKSNSVNRRVLGCIVFTWRTFLPNFIPSQFETTEPSLGLFWRRLPQQEDDEQRYEISYWCKNNSVKVVAGRWPKSEEALPPTLKTSCGRP